MPIHYVLCVCVCECVCVCKMSDFYRQFDNVFQNEKYPWSSNFTPKNLPNICTHKNIPMHKKIYLKQVKIYQQRLLATS
jgi:hypothetical protein